MMSVGCACTLATRRRNVSLVSWARSSLHNSRWGGRPRPRRTPWSGSVITRETEADLASAVRVGPHLVNSCWNVSASNRSLPVTAREVTDSFRFSQFFNNLLVRNFRHLTRLQTAQEFGSVMAIE